MVYLTQGVVQTQSVIHPKENEAKTALQKNLMLIELSKDMGNVKLQVENSAEMRLNNYLVTDRTCPRIYQLYLTVLNTVCNLFSVDTQMGQRYPLFIVQDYEIKAETFGSDKNGYYIQITTGAVSSLTDAELRALLGQAVAHIRAGHVQFIELLRLLKLGMLRIPIVGGIVSNKVWSAFAHWQLYSDYTADRVGAVCAGSIEASLSLLQKQIGCDGMGETPYDIVYRSKCKEELSPTGIYFVWIMQQIPACNAIGRMRELINWSREKLFKSKFPYMYYCAKHDMGETVNDQEEKELVRLHAEASAGNVNAIAHLGECYLRNAKGLPVSIPLGLSMTQYAAKHGNGPAIYLLWAASSVGIPGTNYSPALKRQFELACKSRCSWGEKEFTNAHPKKRMKNLDDIVRKIYNDSSVYTVNETMIGAPIEDGGIQVLRDCFLLEADEPIIAYECYRVVDNYCGSVISEKGIYCIPAGKVFPQVVDWLTLKSETMEAAYQGDEFYLFSGKSRIYQFHDNSEELEGTIGELMVYIKSLLSPN